MSPLALRCVITQFGIFTKVKYFPKKLMLFYEAKISAADWALLDREPRAPSACLYQNQLELSWEANDAD